MERNYVMGAEVRAEVTHIFPDTLRIDTGDKG